jgi:glycosyltransferase involved in cell wall biosynthesis
MKERVITPNYNQGQFIEETINTAITQNYLDLEYIILFEIC